jgi:hypothetical protein
VARKADRTACRLAMSLWWVGGREASEGGTWLLMAQGAVSQDSVDGREQLAVSGAALSSLPTSVPPSSLPLSGPLFICAANMDCVLPAGQAPCRVLDAEK